MTRAIPGQPVTTGYRPGDGLDALLAMQLAIADQQDPYHCAVCQRHIGWWHYGFPFPLCCFCIERTRGNPRLCCPPYAKQPCQREECRTTTTYQVARG